jgi:hypothetical protein
MKLQPSLSAFLLLISVSSTALAASATPEEATRLTGVFQSYLGQEPGVVTVSPTGETYEVKIDFAPLITKAAKPDFSAEVTPLVMQLSDQGGGKWQVTQDQAVSFMAKVAGQLDLVAKISSLKATAVFDESIAAFTSSSTDLSDMMVDETVTTPGSGPMQISYSVKTAHYDTSATAAAAGSVDGTMKVTMAGLTETIKTAATPGAGMPLDITITAENGSQDGTFTGVKTDAIYKLVSWLVEHASDETVKSNEAELKSMIAASLPLFNSVATTGSLQNIVVTTPIGPVAMTSLGFDVGLNGIVADGLLREAVKVDGLTLPPGIVPSWATDLVPLSFGIDFKVTDFDLAAPAKIMLESYDLVEEKPPTPEEDAKLLKALLPKGAVSISVGPSKVTAKLYDLGYEGAMIAGPAAMPAGTATVTAKGFDQVMEAIKAAPPEISGQGMAVMIAAKGMAKTEADGSMSWKIENTPSGGILVNGIDPNKVGTPN